MRAYLLVVAVTIAFGMGLLITALSIESGESVWVERTTEVSCAPSEPSRPDETTPTAGEFEDLEAVLIVDDLEDPVDVMQLPGWDVLLVAEKPGRVVAILDGANLSQPVLDISDQILDDYNERGLLTIEAHPDFTENCELYMFFTDLDGHSNLVSVIVAGGDTPTVDLDTMRTHLFVPQDQQYHQSGSMVFGPDGMLWISIGDGGIDNEHLAQDPEDLNGSVLRVDVSEPPYEVPDGNAFGTEIWAMGLRNPWRISIDDQTGTVFIPDTSLAANEELNIVAIDEPGLNFGWPMTEGTECVDPSDCDLTGIQLPDYEFHRGPDGGCAIVGGEVYRGSAIPELEGHYFFGDFCKAWIKTLTFHDGGVVEVFEWPELDVGSSLTSFGRDEDGELYFTSLEGGLWKIVPKRSDG